MHSSEHSCSAAFVCCRFPPDWSQIKKQLDIWLTVTVWHKPAQFKEFASNISNVKGIYCIMDVGTFKLWIRWRWGGWILNLFYSTSFFSFVVENCRNIIEFCKAYFFSRGSICCVGRADSYIMVIQAVVWRRWWQNKLKLNVRRIHPAGWTSVLFSCLFGGDILIWPRVLKVSRSSFACAGNPPAQMEASGCNLNKTGGGKTRLVSIQGRTNRSSKSVIIPVETLTK